MTLHPPQRKVNVSNISAVTDLILMKILRVGFWEHLEQLSTVTVTFVQATFVLAIFVHIQCLHFGPDVQTLIGSGLLGANWCGFCSKVQIFHKIKERAQKMCVDQ